MPQANTPGSALVRCDDALLVSGVSARVTTRQLRYDLLLNFLLGILGFIFFIIFFFKERLAVYHGYIQYASNSRNARGI